MGVKCLWTGVTFILAITAALRVFGLDAQKDVIEIVGAVFMLIGLWFLWNDK